MGKYFGTDGFRGEAGITLTADHAYKGKSSVSESLQLTTSSRTTAIVSSG